MSWCVTSAGVASGHSRTAVRRRDPRSRTSDDGRFGGITAGVYCSARRPRQRSWFPPVGALSRFIIESHPCGFQIRRVAGSRSVVDWNSFGLDGACPTDCREATIDVVKELIPSHSTQIGRNEQRASFSAQSGSAFNQCVEVTFDDPSPVRAFSGRA